MTSARIRRPARVAVVALVFLLTAGAAFAESVRVVVDRATIWRTPTGTGGIVEIAKAGTILDVRGRQGRWIVVESSTDPRQIGYILAAQTEPAAPTANAAPGARTAPTQTRTATPPRPPAPRPRPFLYGGIMFQASSSGLEVTDTRTTLLEPETRTTQYGSTGTPGFDVGGGVGIARGTTLRGVFVMRSGSDTASVSAQIPHPIFYGNRGR